MRIKNCLRFLVKIHAVKWSFVTQTKVSNQNPLFFSSTNQLHLWFWFSLPSVSRPTSASYNPKRSFAMPYMRHIFKRTRVTKMKQNFNFPMLSKNFVKNKGGLALCICKVNKFHEIFPHFFYLTNPWSIFSQKVLFSDEFT